MRVKINGEFFRFFNDLKINFSLDTFASTFSFNARFNPGNRQHKEIFKPLSFSDIEIYSDDGNLLLTGYIVNHSFNSTAEPSLVSLTGYTKSGILEDVTIPNEVYPLEKNNQSLREITDQLIKPFSINQLVESSVSNKANLVYKKAVAEPTDSVAGFLSGLASQRNIIVGHTKSGDLRYFTLDLNQKPIKYFDKSNSISMALSVNGRGFHSDITVIRQPSENNKGVSTKSTSKNNILNQKRTVTKKLTSGEDTNVTDASNNALAAELKNIVVNIAINEIIHSVKPGDVVGIQNDEIFIYNMSKFVINDITISQNTESETMNLSCVLPESFTGQDPVDVFS